MAGCPHKNIVHCPLYIASHDGDPRMNGCDDGRLDEGGCAVDRGMDYAVAVGRISGVDPRLVAQLRWNEEAEEFKAQRARNMRAAGIH